MSVKQRATNGLKLLLNNTEPFSQAQASWRFLNNSSVSTEALFEPIIDTLKTEIDNMIIKHMDDIRQLSKDKSFNPKPLLSGY